MDGTSREPPLRLVLVDGHELVRSGLRALLAQHGGVEVVGEARDIDGLMRWLSRNPADVVLCDVQLPGLDGVDALEPLREAHPQVRVLLLSMDDSTATARIGMARGAAGYLLKTGTSGELALALRAIRRGEKYVSPGVARALLKEDDRSPEQVLTARQLDVLRRIALGQSTAVIARDLGLSATTVEEHRTRISERLQLRGVASLTRYAMRHRLVK